MLLHYIAVALVDAGLVLALVGVVSAVRPLRFASIKSRRQGLVVLAAGVVLACTGALLPAPPTSIATPGSELDRVIPTYQFSERHEIRVDAPPSRTFAAIRAVTASEITLFRTLTSIRRLGRKGPESILDAPEAQPILDVATRTEFLELALEPDREIVLGTLVLAPPEAPPRGRRTPDWYRRLTAPGYAKAVMNFLVEADGAGSRVTTETRVFATDASSRRRFAAYWRVIYPGSATIRWMWLRAIRKRAEAPALLGGAVQCRQSKEAERS